MTTEHIPFDLVQFLHEASKSNAVLAMKRGLEFKFEPLQASWHLIGILERFGKCGFTSIVR